MLAGVACCGCAQPLAAAQRLFFHLIEAFRLDRSIAAPKGQRPVVDAVADYVAFVSRRELHFPPEHQRRHAHSAACLGAAVLMRRMTATDRALPGLTGAPAYIEKIIDAELAASGGDAAWCAPYLGTPPPAAFRVKPCPETDAHCPRGGSLAHASRSKHRFAEWGL